MHLKTISTIIGLVYVNAVGRAHLNFELIIGLTVFQ